MRGSTLNWVFFPEPQVIIAINTTSSTGHTIGRKINEVRSRHDPAAQPDDGAGDRADGLRYRFNLWLGVA